MRSREAGAAGLESWTGRTVGAAVRAAFVLTLLWGRAAWPQAGAGEFGFVVGVDRVGQAEALKDHGADIVVTDLAELMEQR